MALPQFRAVSTLLGHLKTAGAYHSIVFRKYGHRYLAEFQYRFNRRFNFGVMLRRLVIAVSGSIASPLRAIRAAEICT